MNKVQLGDGKEEGRTLDLISKCGGWPTEAACKAIATRRIVNSNLLLFESSPHRCPFKINCQNLSSMYNGAPHLSSMYKGAPTCCWTNPAPD